MRIVTMGQWTHQITSFAAGTPGAGGIAVRRWARAEPVMVHEFWRGFPASLTFLKPRLQPYGYRLKTTNLAEGFFRNLRRFLGRFPGFTDPAHSERALGLYLLGAEMN